MAALAASSREFRAMGSDCVVRIVVDDDRAEPILDRVEIRMRDLEQRWSRFIDSSELSQLNRHAGDPVFVSPEMFAVVALAIDAWRATDELFDPTLLDVLRELGYDETFDELVDRAPFEINALSSSPGVLDEVVLDARSSLIHGPVGLHFDLGGIGKGHAADLLFAQAMEDGATGVCLDFGGDIRVGGETLEGDGWVIVIDDPFHPGEDLAVLGLESGSVATSSRMRRKWSTTNGEAHHLIDPKTAKPSQSGLTSVTVIAAHAAWGEAHAKAALIGGAIAGRTLLERAGLSGLLVADDGQLIAAGHFNDFVVKRPTLSS